MGTMFRIRPTPCARGGRVSGLTSAAGRNARFRVALDEKMGLEICCERDALAKAPSRGELCLKTTGVAYHARPQRPSRCLTTH